MPANSLLCFSRLFERGFHYGVQVDQELAMQPRLASNLCLCLQGLGFTGSTHHNPAELTIRVTEVKIKVYC